MKLKAKLSAFIKKQKLYWKKPPEGRYMTYKEILSYSAGGIGVKFIIFCISNMILAVGNGLIGNTIGIAPKPLYAIYLLSVLSGFPLTALRARMIDNARSKKGKYRPYLLRMGIPTAMLGVAFIWMPYENMSLLAKCIVVLLFNIGFQFFYNFMTDSYDSLLFLLSPNTIERSDVCSIKNIVDNIAPSIGHIFLPIVAFWITGDRTIYDIRVYRYIYPPLLLVGLLLSILVYVNTEEKIVQAKTHVIQVRLIDAFRAISKNKYFWILSLAGWLGFLEGSFENLLGWLYNYQKACSPAQYSLITAITGNASFWPNVIAPPMIRKYGKRNILIVTNIMNIFLILIMYPVVKSFAPAALIWMMTVCYFINKLVTALGHLLHPSINADIRDYQQYITGERIDGMFAAVGLIGSVVTMVTGFVLPAIYEKVGLNETVAVSLGYSGSNVYDVLYNAEYFANISGVLVLASVVGAILNAIPFFFFDLTETKQRAMVTVLKIRALFEDYGNDALSDEALIEAIDIIEEAKLYADREPNKLNKDGIKSAKKLKDKQAVRNAKKAYEKLKEENEKIEIAKFVIDEINRFETPEGKVEIENARIIAEAGLDGFMSLNLPSIKQARAMPKTTALEKEKRRAAIIQAENIKYAKKAIKKHYPNGLVEFDKSIFDELFAEKEALELRFKQLLDEQNGDKQKQKELKREIEAVKQQRLIVNSKIKDATKQNSIYTIAAKPYLNARKLLIQKENYSHYKDILERYEKAKEHREKEKAEATN